MTPLLKSILHKFDEHVFGSMRSDIDAAMRGNAHYLAALGLVCYTEFLGGLWNGYLGERDKSKENFKAFLPYLGNEYVQLAKKGVDVYSWVRCGLVHNYFIKNNSGTWLAGHGSRACGIVASAGGPTYFLVNVYRDHFFAGAVNYRDDIIDDAKLVANFQQGKSRIGISLP